MTTPRVFLTGGDHVGWAQDEGLRLVRAALQDRVELTALADADIVHAMWWRGVLALPTHQLAGKRIVSYVGEEVLRVAGHAEFGRALDRVTTWIARGTRDVRQLAWLGVTPARTIPYMVDTGVFRPLGAGDAVAEIRRGWAIPEGRYLIGSFQRDTEGRDLRTPKLVKGPDVFAEIVAILHRRGLPIHVVLAGPRRFWLRDRLNRLGVPFTYVGQDHQGDDIAVNTQPRSVLNVLYNLVDLYLVTSRSENAPNAVMEAAAAGCRIVSTPVGVAPDVLDAACLYRTMPDAIELIAQDIADGRLAKTVDAHLARIAAHHAPPAVAPLLEAAYRDAATRPAIALGGAALAVRVREARPARWLRRVLGRRGPRRMTVSLWNTFYEPPYGGANQFMLALRAGLERRGVRVLDNHARGADVHVLQSIWFDVARFRRHFARHPMKVVHRIDGPIQLIRGRDREKDDEVFGLNADCAAATVVQSGWCLERLVELGYRPVKPVVIHNAADPDIFHARARVEWSPRRKVRLISTAWSDNPRKGAALYQFLDEHLDWSRFEYTFVGRVAAPLSRIRVVPPVASPALATLLREHDVYVTASRNDPCSNALIEALSCGLPALYRDDGGHPELVGQGGLPFRDEQDVLAQLDRLVEEYPSFQAVVAPPTMDEVAERYLSLILAVRD